MSQKRPYSTPQMYEVKLDQEQAILSACSITASSISNDMPGGCRPLGGGNCKRRSGGGGGNDNGPRAS